MKALEATGTERLYQARTEASVIKKEINMGGE